MEKPLMTSDTVNYQIKDFQSSVAILSDMAEVGFFTSISLTIECSKCKPERYFEQISLFLVHVQLEHTDIFQTLSPDVRKCFPIVDWNCFDEISGKMRDWQRPDWCKSPAGEFHGFDWTNLPAMPPTRCDLQPEQFFKKYLRRLPTEGNMKDCEVLYHCTYFCPGYPMENLKDFYFHFWKNHTNELRELEQAELFFSLPVDTLLADFVEKKDTEIIKYIMERDGSQVDEEQDWEKAVVDNGWKHNEVDANGSVTLTPNTEQTSSPETEEMLKRLKEQVHRCKTQGGPPALFDRDENCPILQTPIEKMTWGDDNFIDRHLARVPDLKTSLTSHQYEMLKITMWEHSEQRRLEYAMNLDPLAEVGIPVVLQKFELQFPAKERDGAILENAERAINKATVHAAIASFRSKWAQKRPNFRDYDGIFQDLYGYPLWFARQHQRTTRLRKILDWRADLFQMWGLEKLETSNFQIHFNQIMELCDAENDEVGVDNLFRKPFIIAEVQMMKEMYEKALEEEKSGSRAQYSP